MSELMKIVLLLLIGAAIPGLVWVWIMVVKTWKENKLIPAPSCPPPPARKPLLDYDKLKEDIDAAYEKDKEAILEPAWKAETQYQIIRMIALKLAAVGLFDSYAPFVRYCQERREKEFLTPAGAIDKYENEFDATLAICEFLKGGN